MLCIVQRTALAYVQTWPDTLHRENGLLPSSDSGLYRPVTLLLRVRPELFDCASCPQFLDPLAVHAEFAQYVIGILPERRRGASNLPRRL